MVLSSSEVSSGSGVGEEAGFQGRAGGLHQRVAVAAAFEDAGFHTAGAVGDDAVGELREQCAAVA